MWYSSGMSEPTVTLKVKPATEATLLLRGLALAGLTGSDLHTRLSEIDRTAGIFTVLPSSLSQEDLDAFGPLMQWLEEPVPFALTHDELWRLHGAVDTLYRQHRPTCRVTKRVWDALSHVVGDLDGPPE